METHCSAYSLLDGNGAVRRGQDGLEAKTVAADNYPHDTFFVGDEKYHRQAVLTIKTTTNIRHRGSRGTWSCHVILDDHVRKKKASTKKKTMAESGIEPSPTTGVFKSATQKGHERLSRFIPPT